MKQHETAKNGNSDSLSKRVLILNQSYEPITICTAKKAIILIYLSKAEIVNTFNGKTINTVSRAYPLPSVIRLGHYVRIPYKRIELSRKNVHRRDGFRCQYCGEKASHLTLDHVIPKSRGGADIWDNLVSACKNCNNKKGNRTPEEAKMPLIKRPETPHHLLFMKQFMGNIRNDWRPYLFMD